MRPLINLSIRTKIILLIVLVSTINIILASIVHFYYEKKLYYNHITEKLRILSDLIGDYNSATILFSDEQNATNYLSSLKADKHVENALLLLPDSSVLAQYKKPNHQSLNIYQFRLLSDTTALDDNYLVISRPVFFKGEAIATIRIEYSLSEYKIKQKQYAKVLIIMIVLSIITATFLAYLLQTSITRPLFLLSKTMNRISIKKDYSIRAGIKGYDEVGKLTEGFNFMIQQIEEQNNKLKTAKAESDSALKTKERFLANMTHELRTPLNSIVGLSNLLEETALNENQKEYINHIKISSDHLLAIINDLLEFSKLGSGKLQIEKSSFSIRRTIDRIERSMEFELKNRKLRFKAIIDDSVPHFLIGDEHRLNQILINLIGNAIKFTPKGSITVELKTTLNTAENIFVEFRVCDTGIGIAKEKQAYIFESFTQESAETNRQYGGTGLGLAITKQLVELQNGKIWVESEKFEGSCFIFTIPYDKKESPENKNKPIDIRPIANKKVLVVDDNSMNLLFTKSLLDKSGFETVTCENGLEAIEQMKSAKFDMILMDLHMPKMDGYETSRQIRLMEAGSTEKIPIIALTAAATLNEIKKCFDSGMNDYLVKPFKKEELFSKLLSLLLNKPTKKND